MRPTSQPRVNPYAVRRLTADDRGRVLEHLLAQNDADRALRFGVASDDAAIARYVDTIDFDRCVVLGAADGAGALAGVAHMSLQGGVADVGLSVTAPARRRGLGRALAQVALAAAVEMGAREFRWDSARSNIAMHKLARRLGLPVTDEGPASVARRALARTEAASSRTRGGAS